MSTVRWSVGLAPYPLAHEAALLPGRRLGSIFFGGGTPSLMPPETVAAILGAALNGLQDRLDCPPPISGNAYDHALDQLPATWGAAIDAFERCPEIKRILPQHLIDNLVMTKRQELHYMAELSDEETVELYLDNV